MKISEIPVVILAAGKGTRLGSEFDGKNKTLLPFNENYTLLDLLLYQLISFGVKSIIIIGGYRFEILKNYIINLKQNFREKKIFEEISEKFIQCNLEIIKARDDYEKGPLYTLLSISKYISKQKKDSNIQIQSPMSDRFTSDRLYQSKIFTIIPSDTVFSNELLQKIINIELFENENREKNLKEESSACHLFGLMFSREKLKEMKLNKKFSGSCLEFRQEKLVGIKNFVDYNFQDSTECFIQIPIVVISKKFIKFSETLLKLGINKLAMVINEFRKNDNDISMHVIQLENSSDFFTDVDTIKNYSKLIEKIDDFKKLKK